MISGVISASTLGIQQGVGCGRQETMVCAGGVGCGGPPDLTFFAQDTGWRGVCGRLGCCEGPLSSALPLMHRRRGSTHGYAHSEDLETGVRRSGATDRRADGVTTRALQPPL